MDSDRYLVIAKFALTYSAAKLDKEKIKTPNEVRVYRTDLAETLNMFNKFKIRMRKYICKKSR